MKKFIVLIFNFDEFQVNFIAVHPLKPVFSISYVSDFAYEFNTPLEAEEAIEFIKCKHKNLHYEIVEKNCLNFK